MTVLEIVFIPLFLLFGIRGVKSSVRGLKEKKFTYIQKYSRIKVHTTGVRAIYWSFLYQIISLFFIGVAVTLIIAAIK
jgi:hypothetical protein